MEAHRSTSQNQGFPTGTVGNFPVNGVAVDSLPFVSSGGALARPLGNRGDLPPPPGGVGSNKSGDSGSGCKPCCFGSEKKESFMARRRRARHAAIQAELARKGLQDRQTAEVLPMPSKSSWCCGHAVIPAKRNGKLTGAPGKAQIIKFSAEDNEKFSEVDKNCSPGKDDEWHGVFGIARCNSPFVCPVCGRKIQAQRREDVTKATKRMLELGYTYIFATFTASHKYRDALKEFIESFQEASRKMKQGKSYKKLRLRWHLEHYIRTAEVTLDHPDSTRKTGWHWHAHHILYLNRAHLTEGEARQLEAELFKLWSAACEKFGLKVSAEHGLKIERPHCTFDDTGTQFLSAENADQLGKYMAKSVSYEMAPSPNLKKGRKGERISSWDLIGLVVFGKRSDLLPKLAEFMEAIKGRRSMYMSRGLADLVGLKEEERTAAEPKKEVIYEFGDDEWMGFSIIGKTRAAMFKLDDGLSVDETIAAHFDNMISKQQLDKIKMPVEDAVLRVWDEDTWEILVTENDVQERFSREFVPILEIVGERERFPGYEARQKILKEKNQARLEHSVCTSPPLVYSAQAV